MSETNIPILMTASVSTRGMKGACFTDEEREKMYIDTLDFYLSNLLKENPSQAIVFAENSGWDLNGLQSKLQNRNLTGGGNLEFISLSPELFNISKGKGYNEMILMTETVKRSKLIGKAGCFFKVTGRYPIYNLGYYLPKATQALLTDGYDLFCDIKDHKIYDWIGNGWNGHSFDCRLFAVTNNYYLNKLAPLYASCDDYKGAHLLEDILFKAVKTDSSLKVIDRFKREPVLGGFAGHSINAISFSQSHNSTKEKVKRFIGNSIRTLTPWFKF